MYIFYTQVFPKELIASPGLFQVRKTVWRAKHKHLLPECCGSDLKQTPLAQELNSKHKT